jgi:NAD(P)-dependent dehydrogenase (short-subunit alcohol dehydrogenase family)
VWRYVLSKAAGCWLRARGIRCNVVCPGLVLSERVQHWWAHNVDKQPAMLAAIPQRRPGLAAEVAQAVAFLGSDEASLYHRRGAVR